MVAYSSLATVILSALGTVQVQAIPSRVVRQDVTQSNCTTIASGNLRTSEYKVII